MSACTYVRIGLEVGRSDIDGVRDVREGPTGDIIWGGKKVGVGTGLFGRVRCIVGSDRRVGHGGLASSGVLHLE